MLSLTKWLVFVYLSQTLAKTILDEPNCGDLKTDCNNLSENDDLLIIECLLSWDPSKLNGVNEICQHHIWNHTKALISNENVKERVYPYCKSFLEHIPCNIDEGSKTEGSYLKCIVNNKELVPSEDDCNQMILRLENAAFRDYQWIGGFLQHCTQDIEALQCGRLDSRSLNHVQTVTCLQSNLIAIRDECKREVLKLSELQSDSIKLDNQLYADCAADHMRYCRQFSAGSGRVFSCLMQQDQTKLNSKCVQNLLRRQKLIAQDYKVSKGLIRACKDDIKKTHCRRQTSNDKTIRLAQILLCLENVGKNGTKIEPDCQAEMVEHRRILMRDYRLSPEIVDDCKSEIGTFCQGLEISKTIHCLMEQVIKHDRRSIASFGDSCRRALEVLVKQADAGEDWRVDPVLHQACYDVVKVLCKDVSGGDAKVMSCLMDNLEAEQMTEPCEDALMQIQYFVARDFKLDPQLYRACRDDAVKHCHLSREWDSPEKIEPSYSPMVFPCLYRYAYHTEDHMQLNKTCLQQIRRVMGQRAISVDLQPEIEEVCLNDLAFFCGDKIEKGAEMKCLQQKLDELEEKCHEAIESYTELEAEHAELNPYIAKYCRKISETLCSDELKHDEGDLMECLISHKNDPLVKSRPPCRSSIEHFQIISVKDYRFTYKFKVACKMHAIRLCAHAKTKYEVVVCLSERVLNDTVKGVKSVIPKECKQQLKAQLFQQRENIEYDPKLKAACNSDIREHCKNVHPGNSQVLECLQAVEKPLTNRCEAELFRIKQQEVYDNSVDYALNTMCSDAIQKFCSHHDRETIYDCLKINKDEPGFSPKCRIIVQHRMVELNTNYKLNRSLQKNCNMDITKFCKNVLTSSKDPNAAVIKCLKESFKLARLTDQCEKEMAAILREQALDISVNPLIRAVCKHELATICKNNEEDPTIDVEECLKDALLNKLLITNECKVEVANMIEESQADIQVDPLLQRACTSDLLKVCPGLPQGNGRHIKCLTNNLGLLSSNCRSLLNKRLEMYQFAAKNNPPENMQEMYQQVIGSPVKQYFLVLVLLVLGIFFIVGVFCGRVSKRHHALKIK